MLAPETHLGSYRLISRIGAGGMGEVWKGEDTRLGRIVAIKVLPPAVAADVEATARLRREARTAAQLYHPNIAMIHAIEQDGDRIFIVMEYVEGEPLSKILARGAMSEAELCRVGRGVADALAEAHGKGIVHRDIKPDNIMVNGQRVKVLDFGIAKQIAPATTSSDAPTTFMTQQGMILGTVHYMSPEQALGKALDARTDIFSLGVVLYEAATGRLPFSGETATETMMHIIRDEPEDAARVNPAISDGMKAIISRCLRKNRDERFASAADLAAALEQQLGQASTAPYTAAAPTLLTESRLKTVQEPPPPKRGRWLWMALGAILLAAGIIGAIASRTVTSPPPAKPAPPAVATQPASTAAVSVTAPPSQIVEKTSGGTVAAPQTAPPPPPPPDERRTATAPPPASVARGADDLYNEAMSQLASGDWPEARKTLHRVLLQDPHYAKAHFRMGEISMFNRNFAPALMEYNAAMSDRDRLDPRERHLTRLGMAISTGHRQEAQKIGREIERQWPGDPDLARVIREFGNEPVRPPLWPRWRKP
jgi:serine/threonine protein kinase/alkylhydroperoxidase/carboxymuconolactone decarboxylase family protein YurZ